MRRPGPPLLPAHGHPPTSTPGAGCRAARAPTGGRRWSSPSATPRPRCSTWRGTTGGTEQAEGWRGRGAGGRWAGHPPPHTHTTTTTPLHHTLARRTEGGTEQAEGWGGRGAKGRCTGQVLPPPPCTRLSSHVSYEAYAQGPAAGAGAWARGRGACACACPGLGDPLVGGRPQLRLGGGRGRGGRGVRGAPSSWSSRAELKNMLN
jgi:hypothetical protein